MDEVFPFDVASYIQNIGTALQTFLGSDNGIKGIEVDAAQLKAITDFIDSLAGSLAKLNGVSPYGNLGGQIGGLGKNLRSFFADETGILGITVDDGKLDSIEDFVDFVAGIMVKLHNIAPYENIDNQIQGLGKNLKSFFGDDGIKGITIDDGVKTKLGNR